MQQKYGCPTCGQPVVHGTQFCERCRTPLNWAGQQQTQPPPVPQQQQQPEIASQQEKEEQLSPYAAKIAEAVYQEARNQAGAKDLMWGFIWLVVGGLITLATYAVAEPGGSFWVMWGLLALGAFYIIRGLYRKITTNTAKRSLAWVLASVLLVGAIVGGTMAITNMMNSSTVTTPSSDLVLDDDHTAWIDETNNIVEVSGTVTNVHDEWSIKDVYIELEATDEKGKIVKTFHIAVVPDRLDPWEKGVYDKTLQVPSACTLVRPVLHWVWEVP